MSTIKAVKKGDFFLRKPKAKAVYIKGSYDRSSKKYECYKFDDVNSFIYLKGDTKVFTEFEF